MEIDELIRAVGSKDFKKNLQAFAEQEKAAKAAKLALGHERSQIARRTEEQDLRDTEQNSRERSLKGRDAAAVRRKNQLDERAEQLSTAEAVVQEEKRLAAEQMSAAKAKMERAEKLIESNGAKKSRLERRMSHLDKMPA